MNTHDHSATHVAALKSAFAYEVECPVCECAKLRAELAAARGANDILGAHIADRDAELALLRALCADIELEQETLLQAERIAGNIVKEEFHKGALWCARYLAAAGRGEESE